MMRIAVRPLRATSADLDAHARARVETRLRSVLEPRDRVLVWLAWDGEDVAAPSGCTLEIQRRGRRVFVSAIDDDPHEAVSSAVEAARTKLATPKRTS